jgi:drug/metabolite transporter (DMT)-like permease
LTVAADNNGKLLGYLCAASFVCIWSSFMVISRYGTITGIGAYDLTALRFLVAGVATLPFVWFWWPRQLRLWQILLIAFCGPGTLYSLVMYAGLSEAPAAYAGVFANGTIPIFTALMAFILLRQRLGVGSYVAVGVILCGCAALAFSGTPAGEGNVLLGAAFFVIGSAVLSVYSVLTQKWQVSPKQALVIINIPNMLCFLPVWYFFLPSSLAEVAFSDVVLQGLFQGLGPGFIAIFFFTTAILRLGSTVASGFTASVPAVATLLAIPVLGEVPNLIEWAGVGIVTIGLSLLIWRS